MVRGGDFLGQGASEVARIRRNIAENVWVIWNDTVPERAGFVRVDDAEGDEETELPILTQC